MYCHWGLYVCRQFYTVAQNLTSQKTVRAARRVTNNYHEDSVPDVLLTVTLTRIRRAAFLGRGCPQA
jgi:hypothetical protein